MVFPDTSVAARCIAAKLADGLGPSVSAVKFCRSASIDGAVLMCFLPVVV